MVVPDAEETASTCGNITYTRVLYMDWDDLQTIEGTSLRYTGLNQTVMDMIHSGNDTSRVDEAIEVLHEDGKLDDFVTYARKHGLPEEELKFALEGLLEYYPDVYHTYYPNPDSDGIEPRMGGRHVTNPLMEMQRNGKRPPLTGLTGDEIRRYMSLPPDSEEFYALQDKLHSKGTALKG